MVNIAIKGIIFDFWGTLVNQGINPSPVKQAKRILRANLLFRDYIVRFEDSFMTEEFDNLTDAFKNVAKEFDLNPPEFVYEKLVGMWNKNTLLSKPYDETVEVLEDLKEDYKLILIANTDPSSIPQVLEKFKLKDYFDAAVFSFEIGKLKTDKEMFKKVFKETGLKKDELVMVGDSIPSDMKGAENAGVTPILVDRNDKREYKNKVNDLTELREMIEGEKLE